MIPTNGSDRQRQEGAGIAYQGESARDPKMPIGLARRMVPNQGNIEDFAYGLLSGMVMGNFIAQFQNRNARQPDKDEIIDILSIMMSEMPRLRMSIMEEFDMR